MRRILLIAAAVLTVTTAALPEAPAGVAVHHALPMKMPEPVTLALVAIALVGVLRLRP